MPINEINIKAFGLSGAIQGAKETIGLYADGSDTLEACFARDLWDHLDKSQQILEREFPDITNERKVG
jgi:hypothetical protein